MKLSQEEDLRMPIYVLLCNIGPPPPNTLLPLTAKEEGMLGLVLS